MRILLCNDDGYQATGIVAFHEALKALPGVQVEVVAPEHNNSAKSNALTLSAPLYVYQAANGFRYVNGTPADCVHIALTGLLDYRPDLVVSGINNGANMGDDTIYSGTVGAAMEGYLFGIPAIAFSQIQKGWTHIDAAAAKAAELVQRIGAHQTEGGKPWLLNVNIPNLPPDQLKSPKICRLGRRHAAERVITMPNPRGDTMYWIGGAGAAADAAEGTDFHATAAGHVAITPLKVDLTDHEALAYWAQGMGHMLAGAPRLMAAPPQRPGFPARIDLGSGARPPARPAGRPAAAATVAQAAPVTSASAPQAASMARDPIPARARMLQQLMAEGIQDPLVLRAMGAVDRHHFVDGALVPQAYEDTALPIGLGQTISKPSVVARMTELLLQGGVRGADGRLGRVLDIGTGCGYQAVVLAQLATEVYSIERLRELHEKARANLRPLRLATVHLILGDGMVGFAKGAPYAGIIAAAGGEAVPEAWIDQLAHGGRIVAPVAVAGGQQALMVIDKSHQGVQQTILEAVNFVPLKSGLA